MTWTTALTQIYLTRREVAEHYPIPANTLAKLASQGRGPRFFKPFDKALYRPQDIEEWIEAAVICGSEPSDESEARLTGRGRGRSHLPLRAASAKPQVTEVVSPKTGRRLKSLTPSAGSWLRRND